MTEIPHGEDGMPDLQKLVQLAGGYDKIMGDQWAAYDHAMMRAQSAHRFGDKYNKKQLY